MRIKTKWKIPVSVPEAQLEEILQMCKLSMRVSAACFPPMTVILHFTPALLIVIMLVLFVLIAGLQCFKVMLVSIFIENFVLLMYQTICTTPLWQLKKGRRTSRGARLEMGWTSVITAVKRMLHAIVYHLSFELGLLKLSDNSKWLQDPLRTVHISVEQ